MCGRVAYWISNGQPCVDNEAGECRDESKNPQLEVPAWLSAVAQWMTYFSSFPQVSPWQCRTGLIAC